jgi:hyperosmotically inducible protein
MLWIASGALVAAGLAACGDEPRVAGRDGQATPQAVTLPVAVAPQATPAATADENATLAARVVAALRRDPTVGGLGIDVVGADGVVTLFGTAPTAGDREQAARLAASVDGVRSVLNNLVVVAGS